MDCNCRNSNMPAHEGKRCSGQPAPCKPGSIRLEPVDSMMLAMAYVPWQQWDNVYDLPKAFRQGTIFPVLDKPFCRGGCSI